MKLAQAVLTIAVCLAPAHVAAEFRFDEIEPRDFSYNDEYFLNAALNYRERISMRWRWDDGWRDTAVGYRVSAGSVRSKELYLDQKAVVRLPFADVLTGEYRFVQIEDYDDRYLRNEVEVLFRFFRPQYRLPLTQTLGRTPPPDGLFVGGTGFMDQDKEFADMGFTAGWRGERFGVRLDAIKTDFFYNDKNREGGEYTEEPHTLKLEVEARWLDGDLRTRAWFHDDLPLRLELPRDGGLVFRYRQLRAGGRAAWQAEDHLRFEAEVVAERTRKRRRAGSADPLKTDDLDRVALQGWLQGEIDVETVLNETSHHSDTVFFGLYMHLLEEVTKRPLDPVNKAVLRRGEAYAELGYVLSLPAPGDLGRFGLRASVLAGFLSHRDVDGAKHSVGEKFIGKIAGGFEMLFREGLGHVFFNFTWRADDPSFGGGNVQVMMRF